MFSYRYNYMDTSLNVVYESGSLIGSQAFFYFIHININDYQEI